MKICNHIDYPVGDASSSNCVLAQGHEGCHQFEYFGCVRPTLLSMALTDHEGYEVTDEDTNLLKTFGFDGDGP